MAESPGKPELVRPTAAGVQQVKVSANAEKAMKAMDYVQRQVQEMVTNPDVNPDEVRKDLLRRYYRGLQTAAWPGASSVRGHMWAPVVHELGGQIIEMDWEWLPGDHGGFMVLGFCPECHRIAPSSADVNNATKPLIIEDQVARAMGDPAADAKFVAFRIEDTTHHLEAEQMFNDAGEPMVLLTIREPVRCPDIKRCSWRVRITQGRAYRVEHRVLGSSRVGKRGGPLIIKGS